MALQLNKKSSILDYLGGFAGGVGDVFKSVGEGAYNFLAKPVVDTAQSFGKGLGYAFGGGADAVRNASNQAYNDVQTAHNAFVAGKLDKNRYNQILAQSAAQQAQLVPTAADISLEVDPVRQAANVASLGLTAATAGRLPSFGANVASRSLPGAIGYGALNTAPYGAAFGGLGAAQELGRNVTPTDIAAGAATGGAAGAALGAGGTLVAKGAQKVLGKVLSNNRVAIAKPSPMPSEEYDTLNKLDKVAKERVLTTGEKAVRNTLQAKKDSITVPATTEKLTVKLKEPVASAKNGPTQFLKQKFSDRNQVLLDELRNIEKQTGQTGLVDRFMYNSNRQRGSNATANVSLRTSPNLQTAFSGMDKTGRQAFSDYANARTELSSAGPKTPLSRPRAELQAIVDNASPEHQARFTALNAHYKELASVAKDAGIINQATFDRYTQNDNYVRLQRDMGDLLPDSFGKGSSYQLGSTITSQKRKGSARATVRASETVAQYTQQIHREAAKNRTGTQFVDTLNQAGLAQQLPNATAARHQNVAKIIRDGKVEYYRVSPQIKEAINNLSPNHMNVVMNILSLPGRVARAGITGLNPVFIVRNVFKDQAGSAVNSQNLRATHNPRSFFSGLYNATKDAVGANHDPIWQDFLKHYGDVTSYDLTRNTKSTREIAARLEGGKLTGVKQALLHPIRSLENVASITEKSSRFQQYVGEYRKAVKQGYTQEQASEKAAMAAWQNTVDFSRAGEWGQTLNAVIPYWNPATQGVRQMFRTLAKHPVKSTFTATATVGVPLAASTAWNLSSPENKAIYDNIPEYEKDNNLILIPPGTTQNKDGSYDVIKIPLPPGLKDAFMPVRRSIEAFANDKPLEASKVAGDILQTIGGPVNFQNGIGGFGSSFLPQAVKPFVQQYANQDLFSGKQIVPDYISQATDAQGNPVPESQKAFPYSSGTAEQIGGALGVSPIRVEKFIKDTGGTVGLNLLNLADTAQAAAGTISPENIGGQSVAEGLKRSFGSAQGIDNANKSEGAKYFDNVKKATQGLTQNEQNAFNTLHPASKNFLGEKVYEAEAVYNPAARLDIYNRFPKVFQADKQLDQNNRDAGKVGNPLFDLAPGQVKKVLEHDNLPPGAKDPELSTLNSQEWYADYSAKKSAYFGTLAGQAAAQGKPFGDQSNPYPTTPPALQQIMDAYTALPKGTGDRSAWIRANPDAWAAMQDQFAVIDNWQNTQRGKRGLAATEGTTGQAAGYARATLDSGYTQRSGGRKSNPAANPRQYAVSLSAGGSIGKPKVSVKKPQASKKVAARKTTKPKVTIRRSTA